MEFLSDEENCLPNKPAMDELPDETCLGKGYAHVHVALCCCFQDKCVSHHAWDTTRIQCNAIFVNFA